MAIPFRPVGVGAVAAMKVFRINFSQALSQIPELHAWDDFNLNTVTGKIFTGTTVNGNKPMLGAIGCSVAPAANWWPSAAVACGVAIPVQTRANQELVSSRMGPHNCDWQISPGG